MYSHRECTDQIICFGGIVFMTRNVKVFLSLFLVFTLLFTSLPLGGIVASAADINQEDTLITVEKELTEYRTE